MNIAPAGPMAGILRRTIVSLVRRPGPDLTARQLGIFLTCYLESEPQTVRRLASELHVSKPAITRALDRLAEFDLIRRRDDPRDRRSVLVQRTPKGNALLRDVTRMMADAATKEQAPAGAPLRRPARAADVA
jgi:DNA-binding MarR family transcriptional regulator